MTQALTKPEPAAATPESPQQPRRRKLKVLLPLIGIVVLAAAVLVTLYVLHALKYQSTDDAFIEGHVTAISPQVAGRVERVFVDDNRPVKAGDVLVQIDPADFKARVEQAQATVNAALARQRAAETNVELSRVTTNAALEQAQAGVTSAKAELETARADIAAAEATADQNRAEARAAEAEATRTATDLEHYRRMAETSNVSRLELERAVSAARAASANLDAARKRVIASEARIKDALARLTQAEAGVTQAQARLVSAQSGPQQVAVSQAQAATAAADVAQAQAALRNAELELSYTTIKAPVAGHVTKKAVEPGSLLQVGQNVMAIVPADVWVTANYKETQLTRMRAGQPVTVRIDAYPSLRLKGHVDSIQRGTGARFSLLPPENATGNYVKVVQRVPVKIVLDEQPDVDHPIGPGMSVVPEVQVGE